MPPPPEIGRRARRVRIVKVFIKMKAEDAPEPYRHVRVAGKIKVYLKRVGDNAHPCVCTGKYSEVACKHQIGDNGHVIGKQTLLAKTDYKAHRACSDVLGVFAAIADFIGNCFIAHNRTCDKLRKKRDIQREVAHVFLHRYFAVVYVEHIRHDLKRKERNTDGKRDVCGRKRNGR